MKIKIVISLQIILTLFTLSTGCLGPRKVDKWITRHYGEEIPTRIRNSENISILPDSMALAGRVSQTSKQKGSFLPLLFYWQWRHTTASRINPYFFATNFSSNFNSYAKTKVLKEKLGEKQLQLMLGNNPADFTFHEDGNLIYLLLFYITKEALYVEPQSKSLSFKYRILENGQLFKEGAVNISNPAKTSSWKGGFQPLRKVVWDYLSETDAHARNISREVVDQLIAEL